MVGESGTSFNGATSQEFSTVEEAEIGCRVLAVQRDGTKAPFISGNNRFSLFKWFKRGNRDSIAIGKSSGYVTSEINIDGGNPSSLSTESIDTLCSTLTVHSFAFHAGNLQQCNGLSPDFPGQPSGVGPFGSGAVRLVEKGNNSTTLPNIFSRKKDIGERYSLQSPNTFNSCGRIPVTAHESNKFHKKKVHVKGKRRAPEPPDYQTKSVTNSNVGRNTIKIGRRKRRPAPRPPEKSNLNNNNSDARGMNGEVQDDREGCSIISNDTLILREGFLLDKKKNENSIKCMLKVSGVNSSAGTIAGAVISQNGESRSLSGTLGKSTPRPWYKRCVSERDSSALKKGDIFRNSVSMEKKEEFGPSASVSTSSPSGSSLSRLNFFHRTDRSSQDRRREAKRKSGISFLTNISELDKEAAAIVQEEQARTKVSRSYQSYESMNLEGKVDEELVQDLVPEFSHKRHTRALVSKFDAISNIKKVTVNDNFFPKTPPMSEMNRSFDLNDKIRGHQSNKYWVNDTKSREQNYDEKRSIQYEQSDRVKMKANILDDDHIITSTVSDKSGKKDNQYEVSNFPNGLPSLEVSEKRALVNDSSPSIIKDLDVIFDEIHEQLMYNGMKSVNNNSKVGKQTAVSNQGPNLLDSFIESDETLTETNYDNRSRDITRKKKVEPGLPRLGSKEMSEKGKLSVLMNTENDLATADLKEILKEMKHSLPKRSKTNKSILETNNVSDKPTTSASRDLSAFTSYYKSDDLEKGKMVLQSRGKALSQMRGVEKKKVSSAVQTSGNIRKVDNLPTTSTGNSKQDMIVTSKRINYDTALKLLKNNFESSLSGGLAGIETIKTENIYANVDEVVLPPKSISSPQHSGSPLKKDGDIKIDDRYLSSQLDQKEKLSPPGNKSQEHSHDLQTNNIDTLAVNKLLKKLEAAIASGQHQQAAMLAKELAQLKINCSVVRQRSVSAKVNMYIEDKEAHQGPIQLLLPLNMTVAQLRAKVSIEFEIPTKIQRWIIGKNLAIDENSTLEELQATDGTVIFLYLVAPDDAGRPEKDDIEEKSDKPKIQDVNLLSEQQVQLVENDHTTKANNLKRYEELLSLENQDVISNMEPIDCPICFMRYDPQEGILLRDCLHAFCRPCIANTILYCEEAEVKCPYRDSEYTCESTLQEREIKALVAPEVYQQHLAKSIAQAENNAGNGAFHCKTPDCPGWCIYDDNVNNFLCPVCRMNNCLTCQVIHMGKNCRQYQEEVRLSSLSTEMDQESKRTAAMLEEMVERGEALLCPTCEVVLMKKWGCDWLRCSMCKTEICWVTRGHRWGPGGKGDTSGGCKCGENGLKCHPRCNYCH